MQRIQRIPLRLIQIALIIFSLFILIMPPLKYYALNTHYWDLGAFDHFLYVFAKENNWYWFVKNHFRPILFVYGMLYKIWPSVYILLFLQSLAVLASSYFIYLLAKELNTKPIYAYLYTLFYLMHPMVLYNAFWDFHTDHLMLLLMSIGLYLALTKKDIRHKEIYLLSLIFLMGLIKESAIIVGIFFAIFLLFKRFYRIGTIGLIYLLILWYVVGNVIGVDFYKYSNTYLTSLPLEHSSFPPMYKIWGDSYLSMIQNILLHPLKLIHFIFTDKYKIIYLFVAFAPFLFAAFLAPEILFIAIPGLAISLLSSQPEKYMIYHHYSAMFIIPVFVAGMIGYTKLKPAIKKYFNTLALFGITLIVAYAYAPTPNGRYFYWQHINNYGYTRYLPTHRIKQIKKLLASHLPKDYTTVLTCPNSHYSSLIGHRKIVHILPRIPKDTDYVIIDLKNRNKQILKKLDKRIAKIWKYEDFYIIELK